jgi:hypothetical protein
LPLPRQGNNDDGNNDYQRFYVDGADIARHFVQGYSPAKAYDGMKDRPDTTFGTMNDDVVAHFDPHFNRENFLSVIMQSAWPE